MTVLNMCLKVWTFKAEETAVGLKEKGECVRRSKSK